MSKKTTKNDRQARLEAARKEQQAAEKKKALVLYGAAAAAVVLIAGAVFWAIANDEGRKIAASGTIEGVQTFGYKGGNHTAEKVDYKETPPVGGEHNAAWLNCGIYDKPVPNENAVHSLEHGAVWITYQPDLATDQVDKLKELTPKTYGLLSPFEGMDSPITISAWDHQLKVDSAEDPRIGAFIKEYRQGPQTPEPGAACTGGVGA
jgi:hypothetical protein